MPGLGLNALRPTVTTKRSILHDTVRGIVIIFHRNRGVSDDFQ